MCLLSEQPQLTLTLQSKVLAPQTSHRLKMLELKTSKIKTFPCFPLSSFCPCVISDQGYGRITEESNLVKIFQSVIPTRLKA